MKLLVSFFMLLFSFNIANALNFGEHCKGKPASQAQLAKKFSPGGTEFILGNNVEWFVQKRTCTKVTGCSDWVDTKESKYFYQIGLVSPLNIKLKVVDPEIIVSLEPPVCVSHDSKASGGGSSLNFRNSSCIISTGNQNVACEPLLASYLHGGYSDYVATWCSFEELSFLGYTPFRMNGKITSNCLDLTIYGEEEGTGIQSRAEIVLRF
jgi:hypothetical protein